MLRARRKPLFDELRHAIDDQLLVFLADEAVVENAEGFIPPQPQELLGTGEFVRSGQEKALEGVRRHRSWIMSTASAYYCS